jgi:hypothetical protein
MSALGQKQTLACLFDHLVSERDQVRWNAQTVVEPLLVVQAERQAREGSAVAIRRDELRLVRSNLRQCASWRILERSRSERPRSTDGTTQYRLELSQQLSRSEASASGSVCAIDERDHGIACCCARAANGDAAAKTVIPPMKAHRRIAAPEAQGYAPLCFGVRLQQGFRTGGMGSQTHFARLRSSGSNVCFGSEADMTR